MTHETHSKGSGNRPDDHHHAVEACQHAIDALHDDRLSHAQALLDEACEAVKRAQAQRETAYDCYE